MTTGSITLTFKLRYDNITNNVNIFIYTFVCSLGVGTQVGDFGLWIEVNHIFKIS